jgi:hypothetical protein
MLSALADAEALDREYRRRLATTPEFVDWEPPEPESDEATPPDRGGRSRRWFRW